ncbi:hypothetical protein PybrP1_006137 [[Pythium] brassicae (nom. inval.)]|nr:hypothetical protein PybrP1_006137 [[Pythium] brassicae (nom. inval.)]
MAARVTKLFLQNALQHAQPPAGKGAKSGANRAQAAPHKQNRASKKVRATPATASKGVITAKKKKAKQQSEHFLDVAKKELESADRTRENLRKLQVRSTKKSQRLMAKALALRKKALH